LARELRRELDLIHVVDPLVEPPQYGTPQYFRLHGKPKGDYRFDYACSYTDEELQRVLQACKPAETYCLFNNTDMYKDAQRMLGLAAVEWR
jgi:uncharacterized protein YecE (DUF72 family)